MKKINLLGINVKCHNKREEILIGIIKRGVKDFYRTYKNKPYSIDDAYYRLFGKMDSFYYMDLISYEDYEKMTDNLFKLYQFTKETAENNITQFVVG